MIKTGIKNWKGNNIFKYSWKITLILYITSSCPGVLSKYEKLIHKTGKGKEEREEKLQITSVNLGISNV